MRTIKYLLLIIIVLVCAGLVYLYSGAYNIGTDVPHTASVHWLLNVLRERSIETHAKGIKVPPLNDPQMIATGAHDYAHLCSGCHLAPGMPDTEIRHGLYPQPPDLSQGKPPAPATVFWIVKHGIKFTAMPGWGATHDDPALWSIVAFVEKLPSLSADQYAAITRNDNGEVHGGSTSVPPASPSSVMTPPAGNGSVTSAAPSTPESAATSAAASSQNSSARNATYAR